MQVVTNHGLVSRMNAYYGFESSIFKFLILRLPSEAQAEQI